MPIIPLNNPGKLGLVLDTHGAALPVEAWTNAVNVSFERGVVKKSGAWLDMSAAQVEPYGIFVFNHGGQSFLVYAGLNKVYAVLGGVHKEITRASGQYTMTSMDRWSGTYFNGAAILNNGVDPPQAWTQIDIDTKLVDLPNWPAGYRARVIRAFRNYLVAIGIKGPGIDDPRRVKWSHSAPPGSLPISWDPSDASKEAGEKSLEGDDRLVDCAPLGAVNIIYGETSMTSMQLAPLPFVFSFQGISHVCGAMSVGCVQEINRAHFVLTGDDVVIFDGSSIRSIAEGRIRRWLFKNINPAAVDLCQVVANHKAKEAWILFPSLGSSVLNMAAVWNWAYDTWSIIEVPSMRSAAQQYILSSKFDVWSVDSGYWDDDSSQWDSGAPDPSVFYGRILGGVVHPSPKIMAYESTTPSTGKSRVERIMLALDGTWMKQCLGVWPVISGTPGDRFIFRVGSCDSTVDDVNWSQPKIYEIGVREPKVDLYTTGRYLAISIEDIPPCSQWELLGLGIEVMRLGML